MTWRRSRGAWLLMALALGACQPLGALPSPPNASLGGGGGLAAAGAKSLVEPLGPASAEPSADQAAATAPVAEGETDAGDDE